MLYWFSQTIGPRRGLEDVVRAMGRTSVPGELHLRGRADAEYLALLERLAERQAPLLKLVIHPPAPPDAMVALCAGYDVGLSVESPHVLNRELCAPNKPYTYLLAGLAVVLTDTAGQRPLAADLGEAAFSYRPGDVEALAKGLRRWAEDKQLSPPRRRRPGGRPCGAGTGSIRLSAGPCSRLSLERCGESEDPAPDGSRDPGAARHYGGIERVIADVAAGLSRRGPRRDALGRAGIAGAGTGGAVRARGRVDALEQRCETWRP